VSGVKTNELPRKARGGVPRQAGAGDAGRDDAEGQVSTRAVHRHARVSPYKVREVLDLIRDKPVGEAAEILRFSERDAAIIVAKVLHSAMANAEHNDVMDPEELYVSACFADEGTTIKRWRPRARGRATRIRKRTSHITVIVSRLPAYRLARLAERRRAEMAAQRSRRVAGARRSASTAGDGGTDTRSRADRRRRDGGEAAEVEPASASVEPEPASASVEPEPASASVESEQAPAEGVVDSGTDDEGSE
jgi:large subunit ribosomal protein L22